MALPKNTRSTEKEYHARESASDIRHEFMDGYIYAMTGASEAHIDISGNIFALLHTKLRDCKAYHAEMRVKVDTNFMYPDVSVVCGERDVSKINGIATLLNPTVLFEVLSPSTEAYDRGRKFQEYQKLASLHDYVLVAQDTARIEHFSRQDHTSWLLTTAEGLESTIQIPTLNLNLRLAEVYAQVTFDES